MAILGKEHILERLEAVDTKERLYITPLLDCEAQVNQSSVDLRLSNEFIITQQTNIVKIDVSDRKSFDRDLGRHQELVRINYGEPFQLHPGHLVLGSTLEYLKLPVDVCAQIEGRSSWGRVGLVIATATSIAPQFTGVITLELVNLGLVPITLYPGLIVAQMILSEVSADSTYTGRYTCPTGPQYSRIYNDPDSEFWSDQDNFQ